MPRIAICLVSVLAAALIGPAQAQETDPDQPIVEWVRTPTGRQFAREYPSEAMSRGLSGFSLQCCNVRENGRLDCESVFETPAGMGFGAAAQSISRGFEMSSTDAAAWRAAGARIPVPTIFLLNVDDDNPQVVELRAAIREATRGLCPVPEQFRAAPISE